MPGSLVGFGREGHERREREGAPKVFEENPAGVKTEEGIEWSAGLNRLLVTTDRYLDQTPEDKTAGSGQLGQPGWRKESPIARGDEASMRRDGLVAGKTLGK